MWGPGRKKKKKKEEKKHTAEVAAAAAKPSRTLLVHDRTAGLAALRNAGSADWQGRLGHAEQTVSEAGLAARAAVHGLVLDLHFGGAVVSADLLINSPLQPGIYLLFC